MGVLESIMKSDFSFLFPSIDQGIALTKSYCCSCSLFALVANHRSVHIVGMRASLIKRI